MRLIECATVKHSFNRGEGQEELVFNGHPLELDDDLAHYLLEESPSNFTDVTPPASKAPVTEPEALDSAETAQKD